MENEKKANVLYVDDEPGNLNAFKASFRRYYQVYTASSGMEAKKVLSENEIHILVTDQKMPGMPGTELLEMAIKVNPLQVRILLTAYPDLETVKAAVNQGFIFRFLEKPWNEVELKRTLDEAYDLYLKQQQASLEEEYRQKMEELETRIEEMKQKLMQKDQQLKDMIDKQAYR